MYTQDKTMAAKQLDHLEAWLKAEHPGDLLIPLKKGTGQATKQPAASHRDGRWSWRAWEDALKACKGRVPETGLLLRSLCAVDFDDEESAAVFEAEHPELQRAPMETTRSGRHYLFLRPRYADEEGFWDGARQKGGGLAVDFKSVCSTNTSGLLVVAPSTNKRWVRPPWEHAPEEIPRSLLEKVATAKAAAPPSAPRPREARRVEPIRACGNADAGVADARDLVKLLSPDRAASYPDWIRVGWCLHNISATLLVEWIEFSRQRPAKFVPGECEREWRQMRGGLGIGSLHLWAREDSPQRYKELICTRLHPDVVACDGSHNSVAAIAAKALARRFVCASGDGKVWYRFDGTLWTQDDGTVGLRRELSSAVRDLFVQARARLINSLSVDDMQSDASATSAVRANKAAAQTLSAIAFTLRNKAFKDSVVFEMREFMYDRDFLNGLDADPNLLAFSNGVWDLRQGAFRPGCPEDRASLCVGYPYIATTDGALAAKAHECWRQIHPDPEQRSYMQRSLARQLYGDSCMNLFHIHAGRQGSAGNGKSTFWDLMELAGGQYVTKFDVELITAKARPEAGKPQPMYEKWKGRRVLYCSEPNDADTINSGIMKDLTGGEKIMYRLLYSNHIVEFRPQFKMHIMCNEAPGVNGADAGVQRRIRKVDYVARFVPPAEADPCAHAYPADPKLLEEARASPGLRMEFLRVLLAAYDHAFAFQMPESVRFASGVYLEENNAVQMFARECIERRAGAVVTLKEAKKAFRDSDHGKQGGSTGFKNALERVLRAPCLDQLTRDRQHYNACFDGFALVARGALPEPLPFTP